MFNVLFVDLPLALVGYLGVVFLLSRFTLPQESADSRGDSEASSATLSPIEGSSEASTTETWQVDHEPEGLTELDDESVAIFDPMAMIEIDEEALEDESDETEPREALPSDPVLRRHYQTHLRMMFDALHRVPEDTILRRHHLHQVDNLFESLCNDASAIEALVSAYEARGIRVQAL